MREYEQVQELAMILFLKAYYLPINLTLKKCLYILISSTLLVTVSSTSPVTLCKIRVGVNVTLKRSKVVCSLAVSFYI